MPMYQDMSYQQQQRSQTQQQQMQLQQMQLQQMQLQQMQPQQQQQYSVLYYPPYQPYQYQAIVNPNYHFEGIRAPQQTPSLQENHLQHYTETYQQTIPYQTELLIQQQMQQQPKQSLQEALNVVGQALQTNVTRTTSQQKAFVDLVSSMGEGLTAITNGVGGGGRGGEGIHSIAGQSSTSFIADGSAAGSTAKLFQSASLASASSTSTASLASSLTSSTIHKPNTSTSPWIPVLVSVPMSVPVPTTVRVSTSTRPLPILTRPSLAPLSSPTSTLPKKSSRVERID